MFLHHFRTAGSPLSLLIGSLCIKHPNLFGGSEKLNVSCDKGLFDTIETIAYKRPRPEWLYQQSLHIQHSITPAFGIDNADVNGVNLSRFSAGLDLSESASSNLSNVTSIQVEFSLQIEQGLPVLSGWLIFNRLKFVGTKGINLGPAFLLTRCVLRVDVSMRLRHCTMQ
ncbi:Outer envelope protein 39, chloroplastic-like protein [Drosera capensis]